MEEISVLHCADMHLGSIVSALDREKNSTRMSEIEHTCWSILDNAKNYNIVLLSGDIFDSNEISRHICDTFLNKIKSIPNTKFFYSCGNHDPYISTTIEYLILNCPDNLHIFGFESVECVTIEELNTRIYGVSFKEGYQKEKLICDKLKCDNTYINILCVHGEISESSVYNPVNISELEESQFDYVALGHIHKYTGVHKIGKMYYAYPGNPEPRGFDELDLKGYISGVISKEYVKLDFVPASKRVYHNVSVDISLCCDYLSLFEKINSLITSKDDFWRISLCGDNITGSCINTDIIKQYVKGFYIDIVDNTRFPYDINDLSHELSLLGLCAKETIKRSRVCADDEKEIYEDAFSVLYSLFQERSREK